MSTPQTFVQPVYPPGLYKPLLHSLLRRGQDFYHLTSLHRPLEKEGRWEKLDENVRELINALEGYGKMVEFDSRDRKIEYMNYGQRHTLPPALRCMVEEKLSSMEAAMVKLGKDVECNGFRTMRRDPRARSEEKLAREREEMKVFWTMKVAEVMGEVRKWYEGSEEYRRMRRLKDGWGTKERM